MNFASLEVKIRELITHLFERAAAYSPNILSALGLLVLGWLLASISRRVISRLISRGLGGLARTRTMQRALEWKRLGDLTPRLVGGACYWIILLFFAATALEKLEMEAATALFSRLTSYLPRVLFGVLIAFAGIVGGSIAFTRVSQAVMSAGYGYGVALGRTAQVFIVFVAVVMGADQIGIHSTLLTGLATIIIGASFAGAALAFGLGSGSMVSNIISTYYLLKTYQVGQTIRVGDVRGRILEITQTGVVLETPEGRAIVPAKKFGEETSVLLKGEVGDQ